jgi:hypothetical protein
LASSSHAEAKNNEPRAGESSMRDRVFQRPEEPGRDIGERTGLPPLGAETTRRPDRKPDPIANVVGG